MGAPLGRELGILRGRTSAIFSHLISQTSSTVTAVDPDLLREAREISAQLGNVRFSDIQPRDLEAEQHAREHLEMEPEEMLGEEIGERRRMEGIEDMLARLSTSTGGWGNGNGQTQGRPTQEVVRELRVRLEALAGRLGLGMNWN